MLFDAQGQPKNAQIARLFALCVGPWAQQAPIDFIFVSNKSALPLPFRVAGSPEQINTLFGRVQADSLVHLRRSVEGERHRALLAVRSRAMALRPDGDPLSSNSYVHFLYGARASVMLTAFFPSVALTIALEVLEQTRASVPKGCPSHGPS